MSNVRSDFAIIARIIKENSKLLDLGCCEGQLLEYLIKEKNIDGRGIEISQDEVSSCVKKGLSVIQGDADTDLQYYPDKCFDYVVSSQMLQATKKPKLVLQEMMRIANNVIISIPNFGNWRVRSHLFFKGKMPVTKELQYQWYDTPNIHFSTVIDFQNLCKELNYNIKEQHFIDDFGQELSVLGKMISYNLLSERAVFLLQNS